MTSEVFRMKYTVHRAHSKIYKLLIHGPVTIVIFTDKRKKTLSYQQDFLECCVLINKYMTHLCDMSEFSGLAFASR